MTPQDQLERVAELAVILESLGESARDAVAADDCRTVAARLQSVVLTGAVTLNELGAIAGWLGGER